jgi:GT2 family glycosyltransferase
VLPDSQRGPEAPSIAIVIPNYNGCHLLETCLSSLHADLDGKVHAEIIVVDNGSTDESVSWLAANWPEIRAIEIGENLGFAAACNIGAANSHAPIVVFHNNDAVVQAGWSQALQRTLESAADVVIAGGLTLFLNRPSYVNSAGIRFAISGAAIDNGFGRPLSEVDLRERDIAGVSGVSMAVRREWFEAAGGFDEEFFMYFEDADLCLRAWVEGYRVRFTPDAVVAHAFGATSGGRYTSLRNYYGSRNRLLTAAKSFGIGQLIVAVTLSIAQDGVVVLWLVVTGRLTRARMAAAGKLKGTFDGVRALPRYLSGPRRSVRRQRSARELRACGVFDNICVSLREFLHMRRIGQR